MESIVGKKYKGKPEKNIGPPGHEKGIGIGRHGRVDPIDFLGVSSFAEILIFHFRNVPWVDNGWGSRFYFERGSLFLKRLRGVTNSHGK